MRAKSFLWGAATSAHQVEGGNSGNDWWDWELAGRVEGGETSGLAADHWNRFREDLKLAREIGLGAYRFSVEWSRIEPEEGRFDEEALARYGEILDACHENGLIPMVTLHHFTNPRWFAAKGGFENPESPLWFERFTKKVLKAFGSRVRLWITFNEPMVYTVGAYVAGFMPPGKNKKAVPRVLANLLRAHVRAYRAIHEAGQGMEVGVACNLQDFAPARAWHPMERVLTRVFDRFFNQAWIDAMLGRKPKFGVIGLTRKMEPVPEALGFRSCDFIGLNFYNKSYVNWMPKDVSEGCPPGAMVGVTFARKGETASDVGWASNPEGFARILRRLGRLGLPVYVTENGIADRKDSLRADYLRAHLGAMKEVVRAGECDLRGYFHWSLLDNFEWIKGYGPRFGLIAVDYSTQTRRVRDSAKTYRALMKEWDR